MVDLFEALVLDEGERGLDWQPMRQRLDARFAQWAPLLGG